MKSIIATVIALTSMSSIAAVSNTETMSFGATNPAYCKLDVTKNEAELAIGGNLFSSDVWAMATVTTNKSDKVEVNLNGSWGDTTAYGGKSPAVVQHTSMNGTGSGSGFEGDSGVVQYDVKVNEANEFELAVEAPTMTHAGDARYDVVVQINCM